MKILWLAAIILTIFSPLLSYAGSPDLQTPAPVIYLADNLDENQNLGWCIDTVGRGLSDRLHAHSCKPFGGDVQFKYDKSTRQIASATFANLCAEVKNTSFGLVKCSDNSPGQKFDYQNDTSEFHPSGNSSLCLAVGTTSRSAGPFMSRDLTLVSCDSIEAKFKQWRIKE
jgi:hypothetical protein